ncbi:hypothetical protein Angca_008050, partial [Angiostrongylus cantonensis]
RKTFFYKFKLGCSAAETARNMNEAWWKGSVGKSTVLTWFRKFPSGDFAFQDNDGSRRPNQLDDNELKALLE